MKGLAFDEGEEVSPVGSIPWTSEEDKRLGTLALSEIGAVC
jgi:hypothetical protein